MHIVCLLLLAAPLSRGQTFLSSEAAQDCCSVGLVRGVSIVDGVVKNSSSSLASCSKSCCTDNECTYFSYSFSASTCLLSNTSTLTWKLSLDSVSGAAVDCPSQGPTEISSYPGVVYDGSYSTAEAVNDPWSCFDSCNKSVGCKLAMFNLTSNVCVTSTDQPRDNLITLSDTALTLMPEIDNNDATCLFIVPKGAAYEAAYPDIETSKIEKDIEETRGGYVHVKPGSIVRFSCAARSSNLIVPESSRTLLCTDRGIFNNMIPACLQSTKKIAILTDPTLVDTKWLRNRLPILKSVLPSAWYLSQYKSGSLYPFLSSAAAFIIPPSSEQSFISKLLDETSEIEVLRSWVTSGGLLVLSDSDRTLLAEIAGVSLSPAAEELCNVEPALNTFPSPLVSSYGVRVSTATGEERRVTPIIRCTGDSFAAPLYTVRVNSGAVLVGSGLFLDGPSFTHGSWDETLIHALGQLTSDAVVLPGSIATAEQVCEWIGGKVSLSSDDVPLACCDDKNNCPSEAKAPECLSVGSPPCMATEFKSKEPLKVCEGFSTLLLKNKILPVGEKYSLTCPEGLGTENLHLTDGTHVTQSVTITCTETGALQIDFDGTLVPNISPIDFICLPKEDIPVYVVGRGLVDSPSQVLQEIDLSPLKYVLPAGTIYASAVIIPSSLAESTLSIALVRALLQFAYTGGTILDLSGNLASFLMIKDIATTAATPQLEECALSNSPIIKSDTWSTRFRTLAANMPNTVAAVELWDAFQSASPPIYNAGLAGLSSIKGMSVKMSVRRRLDDAHDRESSTTPEPQSTPDDKEGSTHNGDSTNWSTNGTQISLRELIRAAKENIPMAECVNKAEQPLYLTSVTPIGSGAIIGDTSLSQTRQDNFPRRERLIGGLITMLAVLMPKQPVPLTLADSNIIDSDTTPAPPCLGPDCNKVEDKAGETRAALGLSLGLGGAAAGIAAAIYAGRKYCKKKTTKAVNVSDIDNDSDGGSVDSWDDVDSAVLHLQPQNTVSVVSTNFKNRSQSGPLQTGKGQEMHDEIQRLKDEMAQLRSQVVEGGNKTPQRSHSLARPRQAPSGGPRRYSVTGTVHRTCSVHRLGLMTPSITNHANEDPSTPGTGLTIRLSDLDLQPIVSENHRDPSLIAADVAGEQLLRRGGRRSAGFVSRPITSVRTKHR